MKPPRCLCSPSCREGAFSETAHNGWHPPSGLSSPYRPPGCSSTRRRFFSRAFGGAVGVSPRLSGRSSPGGGSSVGGPSSALGGAGGTTPLEEAQLLRLRPVPPVPE